eukprot:CAMPEP_0172783690 /NCGR_PEP_ID=MMETSP1074-20121228/204564_1 /TAXON_ID=2916 /ORGANISM="Ceratium fusus, Strain PA161109" /LENGTH=79 /DNA_ID=CAMNT_0013620687 /DNA_START=635 /DNA_END=874 /DNA_ORIENTATION=-
MVKPSPALSEYANVNSSTSPSVESDAKAACAVTGACLIGSGANADAAEKGSAGAGSSAAGSDGTKDSSRPLETLLSRGR